MSSGPEERLCLIPFEVFTQVAFEREVFRRKLLQCEAALRCSTQLSESLQKCLEFWNCTLDFPNHASEASHSDTHRAAISACTKKLSHVCDDIIRTSSGDLLLQCSSSAIIEASEQAHSRAMLLKHSAEAQVLAHSIESDSVKSELASSQHMVSVLRRQVDALEHLLNQERQQFDIQCMQKAQEGASAILSQSNALFDSTSTRIDSLASKLNQVAACLLLSRSFQRDFYRMK
jgi:galactitol-specific phosphotransferase system IIB component